MDLDLPRATAVLARTPGTLAALLGGLPDAWTRADEGSGTWSPHVVVAHLLHAERTNWVPRVRLILDLGRARPLPTFDPAGQFRGTTDAPLPRLLDDLAEARAESLATVAAWELGEDDLAREGEHPTLGRVPLRQLLAAWVAHDLAHLAQVARVMAKQYRDAVGPWRAFLPILDR